MTTGVQAALSQQRRQVAGGLALAGAGARRADGEHRPAALDHRVVGAEEREVGASGEDPRCGMHHRLVAHVAVGEHDRIDTALADQGLELALGHDRDAVLVHRSGKLGRVAASRDAGDLGRGERHDLRPGIVPVDDVEVVEVAPGGAHDHDALTVHPRSSSIRSSMAGSIRGFGPTRCGVRMRLPDA